MTRIQIFALVLALALAGCGQQSTTPSAVTRSARMPSDDVLYGLHHYMTKNGVRTGVLNSDTAYVRAAGQTFDLIGVRLKFFNENGAESGTLTSRTGEYNTLTGSFIARGNAVLVTPTRRVQTEELFYDVKGDQLWSDKPFVMREGGRETRGQSFRSDSRFEKFTVTGAKTSGGLPQAPGSSKISF